MRTYHVDFRHHVDAGDVYAHANVHRSAYGHDSRALVHRSSSSTAGCTFTGAFYLQNQAANECHSPSAACPRWLLRMTCYWARWHCRTESKFRQIKNIIGVLPMLRLSDLTFAPRRLKSPAGTGSRPPSTRGPEYSTSLPLIPATTLIQDLRNAT